MAIFPGLGRFKEFWCQKVLPLVYDDSLSFYEVLCKLKSKLNEVIENLNKQGEYIETQLPILVDETVRKYFNQNQNLPFIDCYAHGITEKLDDIGPALQALINQYGASYAYYMRGKVTYNLNSEVTIPAGHIFRCDGVLSCTFNAKININSESDIYIHTCRAKTINSFLISAQANAVLLTINYVFDFADLFYSGTRLHRSKINLFDVGQKSIFSGVTGNHNNINLQRYGLADGSEVSFGSDELNYSYINITEGSKIHLTLGDYTEYKSREAPLSITTGEFCILDVRQYNLNNPTRLGGGTRFTSLVRVANTNYLWGANQHNSHFLGPQTGQSHFFATGNTAAALPVSWRPQNLLVLVDKVETLGTWFCWEGFTGVVKIQPGITHFELYAPRLTEGDNWRCLYVGDVINPAIGVELAAGHTYFVSISATSLKTFVFDMTSATITHDLGLNIREAEEDRVEAFQLIEEETRGYANATANPEPYSGTED